MSIKFEKVPNDELLYDPEPSKNLFFQICGFREENGSIEVRKVTLDQNAEILDYEDKKLEYNIVENYIKNTNSSKYKIYSTANISSVQLPTSGEIFSSISHLLSD